MDWLDLSNLFDILFSETFWLAVPGLLCGLGALAALVGRAPLWLALSAAAAATLAGFWLTYFWRRGSSGARNALLAALALALMAFVVFFTRLRPS